MTVKFDAEDILDGLDALTDDTYKVARSMGVAAAIAVRDEAKANVRSRSGKLRASLYVAFDSEGSTRTRVRYGVSWNRTKAPHGHLVEFGHVRTNVRVQLPNGQWITTKEKLEKPEFVPARPFLRRAYDTLQPRLVQIAADAGRRRFESLTNGEADG